MGLSALLSSQILDASAIGRSVLTGADASAIRTTLGLGTLATQSPTGTPSASTFLRGDFSWQTIDLSGYLQLTGGTMTGDITFSSGKGITSSNWTRVSGSNQPTRGLAVRDGAISFASNLGGLYWSTTLDPTANQSGIGLVTNGTSTLEQQSGTTAQTFRLYGTYTDASNYERAKIAWESNVLRIGTEKAGTGSARALELQTDGTTRLTIGTDGVVTRSVATASNIGMILRSSDNGTAQPLLEFQNSSGAMLHRITHSVATFANLVVSSGVTLVMCNVGSTGYYQFGTRSIIYAPANAQFSLRNLADTSGATLDAATDGTLAIKNRLGTSDGNITAAAATFSGNVTITQGTSDTSVLTSTGYSLTGSNAQSLIDVAGTWNTTGTPTLIKANVTDTASNAASLLMDLQVGGSSRVSISKNAGLSITGVNSVGSNLFAVRRASTSNPGSLFRCVSDAIYDVAGFVTFFDEWSIEKWGDSYYWSSVQSSLYRQWMVSVYHNKIKLNQNTSLEWYGADYRADTNTSDLVLRRDAAQTLAQRNGLNPQVHRIYNTFTDASNYERGKIEWSSNVLRIGTEKAGTGSARALELQTDGTTRLTIASTGLATFSVKGVFTGAADCLTLVRTGLCSFSLGDANGDTFRIQNAGDSSDMLRIHGTTKLVTIYGNLDVGTRNIVTDTTTGTKIGTATTQKLGFYNATPVVQPTAVADATDAASVITQLNALLSRMRDLGLIAT